LSYFICNILVQSSRSGVDEEEEEEEDEEVEEDGH